MSDTRRSPSVLIGAGLILLGVFIVLAVAMIRDMAVPGDHALSAFIFSRRSDPLTKLAVALNFFGSAKGIGLALILITCFLWKRDSRLLFFVVAGTILLGLGVEFTKIMIARPRPDYGLFSELNYSFPSGHAALSAYLYGWLFVGVRRSRWWRSNNALSLLRRLLIFGLPLLVAAIGVGRVYVGAHWTSDVIGGLALGIGLMLLASSFLFSR